MGAERGRAPMGERSPCGRAGQLVVGVPGAAVDVRVGEEVQARAEPETGPSTLATVVLVVVVRLVRFWEAVGWGLGVRVRRQS